MRLGRRATCGLLVLFLAAVHGPQRAEAQRSQAREQLQKEELLEKWGGAVYLLQLKKKKDDSRKFRCDSDAVKFEDAQWATGFGYGEHGEIITVRHAFDGFGFGDDWGRDPEIENKICGWAWWFDASEIKKEPLKMSSVKMAGRAIDAAVVKFKNDKLPGRKHLSLDPNKLDGDPIAMNEKVFLIGYDPPCQQGAVGCPPCQGDDCEDGQTIPKLADLRVKAVRNMGNACPLSPACVIEESEIGGNSGTPLISHTGEVVGVITQAAGLRSYFVHVGRMKEFLGRSLSEAGKCPVQVGDIPERQFRILLATLYNDQWKSTLAVRQGIHDHFKDALDTVLLSRVLSVMDRPGDVGRAREAVRKDGEKLLKSCSGNVLIWGSAQTARSLRLNFMLPELREEQRDQGFSLTEGSEGVSLDPKVANQIVGMLIAPVTSALLRSRPRVTSAQLKSAKEALVKLENIAKDSQSKQTNLLLWRAIAQSHDAIGIFGEEPEGVPKHLETAQSYWKRLLSREGFSREQNSIEWAQTQHELGWSYFYLGIYHSRELPNRRPTWFETMRLAVQDAGSENRKKAESANVAAIEAFNFALDVFKKEKNPIEFAESQLGVGKAEELLYSLTYDPKRLDYAEAAFQNALTGYEIGSERWASTQRWLAKMLVDHAGDERRLAKAVFAYRAALSYYTRERDRNVWASLQWDLGQALSRLGESASDARYWTEAARAYRAFATVYAEQPRLWGAAQNEIGDALRRVAMLPMEKPNWDVRTEWYDMEAFRGATNAYNEALKSFGPEDSRSVTIHANLASLLFAYGFGAGKGNVEWVKQAIESNRKVIEKEPRLAVEWCLCVIGEAKLRANDVPGALEVYEEEITIARKLVARDPTSFEWQSGLRWSLKGMGATKLRAGDVTGAVQAHEESLSISRKLAHSDRSYTKQQRAVSVGLAWIGDAKLVAGDTQGALQAYEEGLSIARTLSTAAQKNSDWERDVSVSLERIGIALLVLGRRDEALEKHRERHAISEKLANMDRDNILWQLDLVESLFRLPLAEVLVSPGVPTTALESFRQWAALDMVGSPDSIPRQSELIVSLFKLAPPGNQASTYLTRALDLLHELDRDGRLDVAQKSWIKLVEDAQSALPKSG